MAQIEANNVSELKLDWLYHDVNGTVIGIYKGKKMDPDTGSQNVIFQTQAGEKKIPLFDFNYSLPVIGTNIGGGRKIKKSRKSRKSRKNKKSKKSKKSRKTYIK